MELFYRFFQPQIPTYIVVITAGIAIIACLFRWRYRHTTINHYISIWMAACVFLMLYTTIIRREPQITYKINLMPLWSIKAIQSGLIEVLYEKMYNVIFFIPYGILLGLYHTHNFAKAILFGLFTSIGIEFLQLITRTGMCETDDVICNTLGCAVGAMIGAGICRVTRNLRYR